MDRIVRAFPVIAGKEEDARRFAEQIETERGVEALEFYRRFGVAHESWHLQETPTGPWVICITTMGDRSSQEAAVEFGESARGFDLWFKARIREISGVDPQHQPLGPPTECLLDTERIVARERGGA